MSLNNGFLLARGKKEDKIMGKQSMASTSKSYQEPNVYTKPNTMSGLWHELKRWIDGSRSRGGLGPDLVNKEHEIV